VHLVMPVIPHYRVSLFDCLARRPNLTFSAQASRRFPGLPQSVAALPEWGDLDVPCRALLGERLFWQKNLRLPEGFSRGDVLIVIGNPRMLSNFPLAWRAKKLGAGIVWWGHGWSSTSKAWRAALRYRLMNVADAVLLYTKSEVANLKPLSHRLPPMLSVDNALDQAPIRSAIAQWSASRLATFKAAQGIDEARVLLFCGRLRADPPTGLDVALHALAGLHGDFGNLRLCIIGGGDEEVRLRRLAERLGVGKWVIWVGEMYDEVSLAPWFLSSSVFLYPGTIGLSLLHAFGYGLPVVTHCDRRLHGPEIAALEDGKNGLLFIRNDSRDLALKLSALLKDEAMRRVMAANALDTVNSEYTLEHMVENLEVAIKLASKRGVERSG